MEQPTEATDGQHGQTRQRRPSERKSLRRVSFAAMAHVRLYEKEDRLHEEESVYSPIAGLELGGGSAASASGARGPMPDLSSVRRTSDAFNLRLSLECKSKDDADEPEDMSIDSDNLPTAACQSLMHSVESSFDVSVKDNHHELDHDRRDSVFAFFDASNHDDGDEEVENVSPIRSHKSASSRVVLLGSLQHTEIQNSPKLERPASADAFRRRDSIATFFSEPQSPSVLDMSMDCEDRAILSASPQLVAPSPRGNILRPRDSIAPFFASDSHIKGSSRKTTECPSEVPISTANADFPVEQKTNQHRPRDSIAPFFASSEESVDVENEEHELSEMEPVMLEDKQVYFEAVSGVASTAKPITQDFRRRDSVAPFFKEASDEASDCGDDLADNNLQPVEATEEVDYRRRDSVAPFFTNASETGSEHQSREIQREVLSKSTISVEQDYRRRDSSVAFFPIGRDKEAGSTSSPAPSGTSLSRQSSQRSSQRQSFAVSSNQLPSISKADALDQTVNLTSSHVALLADESMELAEDSSFLSTQPVDPTTFGVPFHPSEIIDSFSEEAQDMEISPFERKPRIPRDENEVEPVLAQSTPTSPKSRKSRDVTPAKDRRSSPRLSRSATPNQAMISEAETTEPHVPSAIRTPPRAVTPKGRKKTPVSGIGKKAGHMPGISSPLARNVMTEPSVATLLEPRAPNLERRRSSARLAAPSAESASVVAPVEATQLLPQFSGSNRRVPAPTTPLIIKFPTGTPKGPELNAPHLLNFIKSAKSDTKKPSNLSLPSDEDVDMEEAIAMADDTFNKPSSIFKKALASRRNSGLGPGRMDVDSLEPEESPFDAEKAEPAYSLNDFLQATGLHFIDGLSTMLRRETGAFFGAHTVPSEVDFTRAACLHMPELVYFENTCKALIDHVEEGRQTMRDFETGIAKNSPPIFESYLKAPEEERDEMIAKLKSLKSIARLLTKEEWYQWRREALVPFRAAVVQNTESAQKDLRRIRDYTATIEGLIMASAEEVESMEGRKAELSRKCEDFVRRDPEVYVAATTENMTLSNEKLQLPIAVQEAEVRLSEFKKLIEEQGAEREKSFEDVGRLNVDYEQLCDMMPDDVVGIQENHRLVQTIFPWNVEEDKSNFPCLVFNGVARISLTPQLMIWPLDRNDIKSLAASSASSLIPSTLSAPKEHNLRLLPQIMNSVSHSHTRLQILLADIDEATRECSIVNQTVTALHHSILTATATFSNIQSLSRFTVQFEFNLGKLSYPYGSLKSIVKIYYGANIR
ncbi:Spc7 kinetochore protein-domain-containing protein [Chytriomyces sp. MP71]|nr:Spc7 kinetochore protein-domain-containing protein [Chytriomyces sp. MP71]